jgi:lipopolysaccharide export system protein LptA
VSDKSEYLQNEGRGVYTGNVVATQGESKITTDKLTFVCSKTTPAGGGEAQCDEIEILIAEGKVFYLAPDVRIRGDRAQYDFPSDTITITGDVILSRGEDGVVRGTNVVYSIGEGRTIITAGKNRVTSVSSLASRYTTRTSWPVPLSRATSAGRDASVSPLRTSMPIATRCCPCDCRSVTSGASTLTGRLSTQ